MYFQRDLLLLMLSLITWMRQCWLGFSTEHLFLKPPQYVLYSLEKSHNEKPKLKQWTLIPPPLRGWSRYIFGYLLHGRFVYFLSFIYSIIYILVWIREYLFYILGYNLVLFYLFCCSSCASFGHWEFFQLATMSPWHTPIIVCVCVCVRVCVLALSYLLAVQYTLASLCIYFLPSSRISSFFQGTLDPFIGESC